MFDKTDEICQSTSMSEPTPNSDKQDAILQAAFATFAAYGFRRTSMEDIARAAGISRSALYLYWRNKEDIFRSLTQRFFDQAVVDVRAALSVPGQSAEQALLAGFRAKDGELLQTLMSTPHGAELLEVGYSQCPDIVRAGEARLAAAFADWLRARDLPEGIGSAEEVADSILSALFGLKKTVPTPEAYGPAQHRLARLFARAIS